MATVDGQEVTLRELRAELGNASFATPADRKNAEQAALQAIVNRKLLAKAAEEQKLDKTPEFALQKQRAIEVSLVQSLEQNLAKNVPAVTREEAEAFMQKNPDSFGQRKIFVVDQIRTARVTDPALMKKLEPLNTLEEVEALFSANNVPYQRVSDTLDAATSDPAAIQQIVKLPAGAVFAVPQGNLLLLNRIRETRVQPFTGEDANKLAMQRLRQKQIQEAVNRGMGTILNSGNAKVVYNKDYKPAKAAPLTKTNAPTAP